MMARFAQGGVRGKAGANAYDGLRGSHAGAAPRGRVLDDRQPYARGPVNRKALRRVEVLTPATGGENDPLYVGELFAWSPASGAVWTYNPSTRGWSSLGAPPVTHSTRNEGQLACSPAGVTMGPFYSTPTVNLFSFASSTWSSFAGPLSGNEYLYGNVPAAYSPDGSVLVVFGQDQATEHQIWRYDFDTSTWSTAAAYPGTTEVHPVLAALAADGLIYTFGETFKSGSADNPYIFRRYDPVGDTWATMGNAPLAAADTSRVAMAADHTNRVYLLGKTDTAPELWAYGIDTGTWAQLTSPPVLDLDPVMSCLLGYVHVWTGRGDRTHHRYDPATDTWETLSDLPFGTNAMNALTVAARTYEPA